MAKTKVVGFLVADSSEEWELTLMLVHDDGMPDAGILTWRERESDGASLFATRAAARAAITRTHHWGLAVEAAGLWPRRDTCKLIPVRAVPA